MYLFLWILLIVLGLVFKKSKSISIIQMGYMVLLLANNDKNPDYNNNFLLYTNLVRGNTSVFSSNWLYKLIIYSIGKYASFKIVLMVIAIIGLVLIYKTIMDYTEAISFVMSLYMIAPFVIDATQIKNFLAMAIWLYFSRYLYRAYISRIRKEKWINALYYVVGVFLSTFVHISFGVTIIAVAILFVDTKVLIIVASVLCTIGLLLTDRTWRFIVDLFSQFSGVSNTVLQAVYGKFVDYSYTIKVHSVSQRILLEVIFMVMFLGICWIIRKCKVFKKKEQEQEFWKFIVGLNILILCLAPLMYFSTEFYRFQRNFLVLDYIAFAKFLYSYTALKRKVALSDIIICGSSLLPAIYYLLIDTVIWNYETVFQQLFKMGM